MGKKKSYLVLDCETATLPFANTIAKNAEEKKKIAIAKPLIYDIGWVITNRKGEHIEKKHFLISEVFSVPSVFNTAYYAEKRPLYIDMLANDEITIKSWNEVAKILVDDMKKVDAVGAYNSMFDFKKAIPFTELYISKLYSNDYYAWEEAQKSYCKYIIANSVKERKESEFDKSHFVFRGKTYDMFDLWGLSVIHLLNNMGYKQKAVDNKMYSPSGMYFKSSAEATYRYVCDKYGFDEAHTALEDAIIETYILSKIARKHAIDMGIEYFPFRKLGYTYDFLPMKKQKKHEDWEFLFDMIGAGYEKYESAAMIARIDNIIMKMLNYKEKFMI